MNPAIPGKSLRARSIGGIVALLLVGSSVGTVYANTASSAEQAGTATATGTATGTSTGTSTGTGTKTGTGTGTTTPVPGSAVDKNGIAVDLKPGKKQVAGFSKKGKKVSGTIVPKKSFAKKIKKLFTPGKKVKNVKRTVWVGKKKVGTFKVGTFKHLMFTTAKAPKGKKLTFVLNFSSKVKKGNKWVTVSKTLSAKAPFKI